MNEFIKFIREMLAMSENQKVSRGRFAAILLTAIVIALIWKLPELIPLIK